MFSAAPQATVHLVAIAARLFANRPQRGLDRSDAEISWEEISQLDMIDVSFGAVASQPEVAPFFDGYRFCYSARFARHRSRLIASASRFASNSACRIAFGNSNARRTPERVRTSTSSYWSGASRRSRAMHA